LLENAIPLKTHCACPRVPPFGGLVAMHGIGSRCREVVVSYTSSGRDWAFWIAKEAAWDPLVACRRAGEHARDTSGIGPATFSAILS
jgi:hypothetical protein